VMRIARSCRMGEADCVAGAGRAAADAGEDSALRDLLHAVWANRPAIRATVRAFLVDERFLSVSIRGVSSLDNERPELTFHLSSGRVTTAVETARPTRDAHDVLKDPWL
jgi:hypothetical protein